MIEDRDERRDSRDFGTRVDFCDPTRFTTYELRFTNYEHPTTLPELF